LYILLLKLAYFSIEKQVNPFPISRFKLMKLQLQKFRASSFKLKQILQLYNFILIGMVAMIAGSVTAKIIEDYYLTVPEKIIHFIPKKLASKDIAQNYKQFQSITKWNIFAVQVGIKKIKKTTSAQEAKPLADPSQKLKTIIAQLELKGIVLWGNTTFGLISKKVSKQEKLFQKGEQIFDMPVFVDRYTQNEVWVRFGGEIGVLSFLKPKQNNVIQKQSIEDNNDQLYQKKASKSYLNNVVRQSQNNYEIPAKEIDAALKDLPKLMMQARVVPNIKKGKNEGFIIKSISKGSLYEKLGFKNHDIIKRVNGEDLNTLEKAMNLLKVLKNEREIMIEITRKGKAMSLNYNIH
jgi:type II secretion system protein C